jgi:curved DNA-binding protein CbpA
VADYTDPQFWPQLRSLAQTIDQLDYFQVLNVHPDATPAVIRQAFYGLARALHPDKFFHITDDSLKLAVGKIYKRVNEANVILRDDIKRTQYRKDVSGPDRASRLRFSESSEQAAKQEEKLAQKVAKTPKGEQLYNAALVEIQNGRLDQGYKILQTACLFEGGNQELKQLLSEVDRRRKGGSA